MSGIRLRAPTRIALGQPLMMLFLCTCAMAIGLAIDSGAVPLDVLASLCLADSLTIASSAQLHLAYLPATHGLMLAAAAVALLMQGGGTGTHMRGGACAIAMFGGMVLGAWAGAPILRDLGVGSSAAQLVAAMTLGMAAGTILTMPVGIRRAAWSQASIADRQGR